MALPMPRLAPVTMATRPASSRSIGKLLSYPRADRANSRQDRPLTAPARSADHTRGHEFFALPINREQVHDRADSSLTLQAPQGVKRGVPHRGAEDDGRQVTELGLH